MIKFECYDIVIWQSWRLIPAVPCDAMLVVNFLAVV